MPSVSANLKAVRLEAKYGQSRLAKRAGISTSTYRRAENGLSVRWDTIERIVDALSASLGKKLDASEILDEESAERFSRIGVEIPVYALNRIRKRISDIGLPLDEIARRAELSKSVLSRVLKGETRTTQRKIITKIAAALDFTMESLFEVETEQDRDQKRLLEENLVEAGRGRRLLAISENIPEQNSTIRFGISTGAKLNLVPTLADENDYQIIEGLRTELLAEDGPVKYLSERYLSNPNVPQAGLFGPLISRYDRELSKDPKEVNYTVLYARGARFYAARRIADQQVASGEWPELSAKEAEAIDAICDLHGPLIMASANGRRIIEDAHRYEVSPSVFERDRETIEEFGKAIAAETEILEPEAAEAYRELTARVEGDPQPARSRGLGIAATGSALTVIVGGAVWYGAGGAVATFMVPAVAAGAAGLVGAFVWEAVKTMPRFKKSTSKVGEQFEKALEKAEKLADPNERILLERMADLVRRKRPLFKKVANLRPEFGWVKKYLVQKEEAASFDSFDLGDVIRSSVEVLRDAAAKAGVVVHFRSSGSALVRGKSDEIKVVFHNILMNSIQHGGPGCKVDIGWESRRFLPEAQGPAEIIEIRDTGNGMSPEVLAHAFDVGFRGSATSGPGLGYGLSLSKKILERNAADIELLSTQGKGTTVKLIFTPVDDT